VDSWPVDQDDALARREWGWRPEYDAERAFRDYLIPGIRSRYE
jgi:nucleoside-diphosphate-sugar epimerase